MIKTQNGIENGQILNQSLVGLVANYQRAIKEEKTEGPYLHVDEIASKVAHFYEKIRAVVDWKEEHLLRRTAIERILKRKLMNEISGFKMVNTLNLDEISESLVLALIMGGHFPNNKIPRTKISQVKKVLEKYVFILENNPLSKKGQNLKIKEKVNFFNWILEIAACEIEEILHPPYKEMVFINFMSEEVFERVKVDPVYSISDDDKFVQIYIATQLTLFGLDKPIVSYRLLKLKYPEWKNPNKANLEMFGQKVFSIKEEVENDFNHPLANDFYLACEQYDTLFLILCDVFQKIGNENQFDFLGEISNWKSFKEKIVESYNTRLSTLKSRLFKMATLSTLSVFISSSISLFLVEVPIAKFFYGKFNILAITVDVLLPTSMMFILVLLVKPPNEKNLENLLVLLRKIVYNGEETDFYEIRPKKKRNYPLSLLTTIFSIITLCVSMGFIFWIFYIAKVPIFSVYLDTINVAVVVFAALLIRQKSKELLVDEKPTFWEFIIDTFSVPVGKIGQWVTGKWKEYNIISVFFSVLIDMPFQTIVEMVENWSLFIKEKKARLH